MKCPYLITQIQIEEPRPPMTNQWNYINTEDNVEKHATYCYGRTITIVETVGSCILDECAAFQDGHCVRRG